MRLWMTLSVAMLMSAACASDVVPDGVELEPPVQPVGGGEASAETGDTKPKLKPLSDDEPARVAPLAMGDAGTPFTQHNPQTGDHGNTPGEALVPSVPTVPTVPSGPAVDVPGVEGTAPASGGTLDDLTADQAGAAAPKKRGPFFVNLPDYPMPSGILPPEVHDSYKHTAELRKLVYKVGEDLDAGGKERTRLIYNAEELSRTINKLYETWPRRPGYKDKCISAKRATLVMEEELRNEPRKWSHVRWAFQAVQKEVQNLRVATVFTAEQAPRPVEVVTKDGKTVIVQPAQDTAQMLEDERRIKREELERQKDKMREMDNKRLEDHSNPDPLIQK